MSNVECCTFVFLLNLYILLLKYAMPSYGYTSIYIDAFAYTYTPIYL